MSHSFAFIILGFLASVAYTGRCYNPSPAFPVPQWSKSGVNIDPLAFESVQQKLRSVLTSSKYDTASCSIELTSSADTLWTFYHTAREQNDTRPGVHEVDGNSQYRIASITKAYTVLALLKEHKAGHLDINDPVIKYIPELGGDLPWKDITLRAMASQLSGIPREFGQSDLLGDLQEPWKVGFPPQSYDTLPPCWRPNSGVVCSRKELLAYVKLYKPLFAPNQQSTYSNLNFELLGLVIENVTGKSYNDYVEEAIFKSLELDYTTLSKPSDKHAVLPKGDNYWDVNEGALSPTGGIYSSAGDQSKFLRYVLTHYNALVTGVNWLHPASYSGSVESSYGMPWEIFRTDAILKESKRPVTFVTKSGGLPLYYSMIAALPEYGLGMTFLVGGPHELLEEIIEIVTVDVVRAAEAAIWKDMDKYSGTFVSTERGLNSSMVLSVSPSNGLVVEHFISNGTDVLEAIHSFPLFGKEPRRGQLTPTLLYKNESSQEGEIFRIQFPNKRAVEPRGIWDSFCITDVDSIGGYAGLPSNEVVFWHERNEIELPAWRVTLRRERRSKQDSTSEQFPLHND